MGKGSVSRMSNNVELLQSFVYLLIELPYVRGGMLMYEWSHMYMHMYGEARGSSQVSSSIALHSICQAGSLTESEAC